MQKIAEKVIYFHDLFFFPPQKKPVRCHPAITPFILDVFSSGLEGGGGKACCSLRGGISPAVMGLWLSKGF